MSYDLIEQLRGAAYALPGDYPVDGSGPINVCSRAADELTRLREINADLCATHNKNLVYDARREEELTRLRADVERLRDDMPKLIDKVNDDLIQENDSLRAENDALRKDAERWRTVRPWFRVTSLDMGGQHRWYPGHEFGRHRGATIDDAVDAARAALKEAK